MGTQKSKLLILALALSSAVAVSVADARKGGAADPKDGNRNSAPANPAPALSEYVIGADDVLAINVWKEPEISRVVPVRPDGCISLPLLGEFRAGGQTPLQLKNDITQQLRTYLSHPEVTVIVQEPKSHRFDIFGEVEHPGSYVMSTRMTVLDAIATAGGLRDFAKRDKIYILRSSSDGARTRIPFNYKKVIQGDRVAGDVELQPYDKVVVP
jgi:polysaccharide export outer membrane protein